MPANKTLLLLPGDGIGPEIMAATVMALQALNDTCALKLDFEERTIGMAALEADGSTLSDELMGHIKAADGVILGPCDTYAYPPKEEGGINPSATTRKVTSEPALSCAATNTPIPADARNSTSVKSTTTPAGR